MLGIFLANLLYEHSASAPAVVTVRFAVAQRKKSGWALWNALERARRWLET